MIDKNIYAKEAAERWPIEYVESNLKLKAMSKQEQQKLFEAGSENIRRIATAFIEQQQAASQSVPALVNEHYQWVSKFWKPSKNAYIGLGRLYVEDPRFTKNYDKYAPGCAEFMAHGMQIYAQENLAN
jgi:hypothetical protein